ncbi:hypothetical protein BU24DRAFT_357067 [Aaosphaeria arxii CBS 175.79]|uniref:Carboxymuconolactone decarboxylase-like domain-containing protein n=1 Tax=Aaosphaeria arxii CBS 175.79 TaxID=1450172 RepID=A0A6A5XB14_9PLEO|nr:uncharacterized protein BU24DRAFT_357067 [Aaosphaeria arxii CBS 175.79]KAF2010168.1 hypothetical protein BU24DRAFT_357067 [Aaosphaeria arxii CBS 175.79]
MAPTVDIPGVQPDVAALFQEIEHTFQYTGLGDDRWYILTMAAVVGGTNPELAAQLYLYMINQPGRENPCDRQALMRRLREIIVKLVSIIGVCKPLEAIISIVKVERPEDRDYSFSRENWQADGKNHEDGMAWLTQIYERNMESTLRLFDAHLDFQWISTDITYGLYLSDRQNMDDLDTELTVLVGIMIQNLKLETYWHIRGIRRIGVPQEDVKTILSCVRRIADFTGVKLNRIPTVDEVEQDV